MKKKLFAILIVAVLAISVAAPAYAAPAKQTKQTTVKKTTKKKNGLYKVGKKYKYYKNGKFKKVTGLVKNKRNGKWVYVKKGIFTKFTGVVIRTTDKKTFYVKKGVLNKKFKGNAKDAKGKVYTVKNGIATIQTTSKATAKKTTPTQTEPTNEPAVGSKEWIKDYNEKQKEINEDRKANHIGAGYALDGQMTTPSMLKAPFTVPLYLASYSTNCNAIQTDVLSRLKPGNELWARVTRKLTAEFQDYSQRFYPVSEYLRYVGHMKADGTLEPAKLGERTDVTVVQKTEAEVIEQIKADGGIWWEYDMETNGYSYVGEIVTPNK